MKNDIKNIVCPKCGESISIDDVLSSQIGAELSQEFKEKEKVLRDSLEKESQKKLLEKEELFKKQLTEKLKKDQELEKKYLEEQLVEKDEKLKKATQNEIDLRKEKQKLKDEKDAFELNKIRQMDEERKKIEEDASKKATAAQQSTIDQLNKKLSDATKAKDELARKLEQGSQQTQGEVQEIVLEELLRSEFIYDEISPVPKGVNGADVVQTVMNKTGIECGKIIWESKKTKSWSEGWIAKLKEDQRSIKADIAVIISSVLPEGAQSISFRNGVWVCDIQLAISIGTLLRQSLEAISREKDLSVGKNEKMETLYAYINSTNFRQRIEVIVETFSNMKSSLDKERIYFEKSWSEKEEQIKKVIKNTVGIYGDLSGVVQLQKIEALELPEPATSEAKKKNSGK